MGLTFSLRLKWRDHRLTFINIMDAPNQIGNKRDLGDYFTSLLWLPMPQLIHENAIIGKLLKGDAETVQIVAKTGHLAFDFDNNIEGRCSCSNVIRNSMMDCCRIAVFWH